MGAGVFVSCVCVFVQRVFYFYESIRNLNSCVRGCVFVYVCANDCSARVCLRLCVFVLCTCVFMNFV